MSEPITATPSAPEIMRATVFVAEATPDLAAGTAPTTASVAGAITQPIARVSPKNQAASVKAPVSGFHSIVSARASAKPVRPIATTRVTPSRFTALLDEPAPIISPSAIGLMTAPASIALYPWANCKYWVSAKIPPSSAKNATLTAAVPTLKLALRKKPRSSIGSAMRRSHQMKLPSRTTLAANEPTTRPLDQPCSGASMIA